MTLPRAARDVFAPLETLEGRSLLAAGPAIPVPEGATLLNGAAAVVADDAFLNPAPADAPPGAGPDDSAMYDFGGAWGSRPTSPGGRTVDLADAFDDAGGPRLTPRDVSATTLRPGVAAVTLRDATEDTDGPADTLPENGGGPITISTVRPIAPQAAAGAFVSFTSGTGAGASAKTGVVTTVQPEAIKIRRSYAH